MKMDITEVYLVCTEILPKAIKKTILAKAMINRGEVRTVNEAVISAAVHTTNIKDYVYSFFEATCDKIVTLALLISHRSGTLQAVLKVIAEEGGNVMTINQGLPVRGAATVHISLETAHLRDGL